MKKLFRNWGGRGGGDLKGGVLLERGGFQIVSSVFLQKSMFSLPGISGNLVVKSKLPPQSDSRLEVVEPHS